MIDDDDFVRPEQSEELLGCYLTDPTVPHGIHGARPRDSDWVVYPAKPTGWDRIRRCGAEVDVLHDGYLVHREQVERDSEMVQKLAARVPALGVIADEVADDLVISTSAARMARVHEIGPYEDFRSATQRGIATGTREDFWHARERLLGELRALLTRIPSRPR